MDQTCSLLHGKLNLFFINNQLAFLKEEISKERFSQGPVIKYYYYRLVDVDLKAKRR